jgi:hypothetical protein
MMISTLEVQTMPFLGDFVEILGDNSMSIPQLTGNAQLALPDFNTGGRATGTGPHRGL